MPMTHRMMDFWTIVNVVCLLAAVGRIVYVGLHFEGWNRDLIIPICMAAVFVWNIVILRRERRNTINVHRRRRKSSKQRPR